MSGLPKARDIARGKWGSILPQLGISAHYLDGKGHRCPRDDSGDDRFRFADRDGTGSFHCKCSQGNKGGLALLMCCKDLTYVDACKEVERVAGSALPDPPKPDAQKGAAARMDRIKRQLRRLESRDDVAAYLGARGLVPPPKGIGKARLAYFERGSRDPVGTFTAMVAKVLSADGRVSAFHLTYIDDAKKAPITSPRKVQGTLPHGCAIRMFDAAEEMGIAEGIETALASAELFKVPVWAAINEGNLRTFVPPEGTKVLHIFGDKDPGYAGQAAAYELAQTLTKRGIECEVHIPALPGKCDWNDVLVNKGAVQ